MKRISLQWRLTCIITLYIALICGCLTMLIYKNGVYYIDSLQETVDARGDDNGSSSDEIYISIPEDNWDDFANDFPFRCTITRQTTKKQPDNFSLAGASGWCGHVFYQWTCPKADW